MVANQRESRYWDSDCFLGWLREENDKVDGCRQVLDAADDGKISIFTSTLTLAEVLNLRGRPALAVNRRQAVEKFFNRSFIVPIPLVREIAEMARDLVWDHGIAPKDAVHVASACSAGIGLMNTFDGGLIAKSGIEVVNRRLIIEKPKLDGILPHV